MNADAETIHYAFGDSWRVTNESDWIFSNTDVRNRINEDSKQAETFEPVYSINFASDEEQERAAEMYNNDIACILDVSLAGSKMAEAHTQLDQAAPEVEEVNQLARVIFTNGTDYLNESQHLLLPDEFTTREEQNDEEKPDQVNRVIAIVLATVIASFCLLLLVTILVVTTAHKLKR